MNYHLLLHRKLGSLSGNKNQLHCLLVYQFPCYASSVRVRTSHSGSLRPHLYMLHYTFLCQMDWQLCLLLFWLRIRHLSKQMELMLHLDF